jgi:hypothetical protein
MLWPVVFSAAVLANIARVPIESNELISKTP